MPFSVVSMRVEEQAIILGEQGNFGGGGHQVDSKLIVYPLGKIAQHGSGTKAPGFCLLSLAYRY